MDNIHRLLVCIIDRWNPGVSKLTKVLLNSMRWLVGWKFPRRNPEASKLTNVLRFGIHPFYKKRGGGKSNLCVSWNESNTLLGNVHSWMTNGCSLYVYHVKDNLRKSSIVLEWLFVVCYKATISGRTHSSMCCPFCWYL